MEDEFELISKEELRKLKGEIKELKEKKPVIRDLEDNIKNDYKDNKELVKLVVSEIKKEFGEERKIHNQNIEDIKDLNKKTLDNILHSNQSFDIKLDSMIDNLKSLIETLTRVIDKMPKNGGNDEIKNLIEDLQFDRNLGNSSNEELETKVDEIMDFMKKLKVLLSQVKPNNMNLGK